MPTVRETHRTFERDGHRSVRRGGGAGAPGLPVGRGTEFLRIDPARLPCARTTHDRLAECFRGWLRRGEGAVRVVFVPARIARQTGELTAMWWLGRDKRDALLARTPPIRRWDDPALSAEVAGLRGETLAPRFDAILEVNRDLAGAVVRPARVTALEGEWRVPEALEFFVDFETVNDCDDDFSRLPERGGQPLIFMVGCGHVEDGRFVFRCFTADSETGRHPKTCWQLRDPRGRGGP